MWDVLATVGIVLVAAFYFLRRLRRNLSSKTPSCCDGCSCCGGSGKIQKKPDGGACHG